MRRVAEWLRAQSDTVPPQRIIASLAPRAVETGEIFADVFGLSGEAFSKVRELYNSGANEYLNTLVKSLTDEVSCVLVVGHNPAVSELLAALTGAMTGDYLMRKGDAACVTFEVPETGAWEEIYAAEGKLERYVIAASV